MVETKAQGAPPPKPVARKSVPINAEYEVKAKVALRDAMTKHGSNYEDLGAKLRAMGVEITDRGLENKISRGGFSAAFMLQCLDALQSEITN